MLSKDEILELSLLNLFLKYPEFCKSKIEDLSSLEFNFSENKILLSELISSLMNESIKSKEELYKKLNIGFENLLKKINMYANNKSIISNLNEEMFASFMEDFVAELNLLKKNKELTSIESELAKNPNDITYDRYISLKNS